MRNASLAEQLAEMGRLRADNRVREKNRSLLSPETTLFGTVAVGRSAAAPMPWKPRPANPINPHPEASPPKVKLQRKTTESKGQKSFAKAQPKELAESASVQGPALAKRKKAKADVKAEAWSWRPSADYVEQANELRQRAAQSETLAATVKTATFERRLGAALLQKSQGKKLDDLIREWDKNGDGDINTIEFRACVRNSLGLKAENKEIDAFFSSVDTDGGGSLDLPEFKPALKALRDAAFDADAEAASLRIEAAALRERAEVTDACAAATAAVEAAEAQQAELLSNPTIERRLGAAVVRRNMKIGDLVNKWDKDGDGSVSKAEFRANVLELVKDAQRVEVDALFDSYDDDGGGDLSLNEMKPTLKKLIDAAQEQDQQVKALEKEAAALRKEAAKQQKALFAAKVKEAAEARAKAAAEEVAARAAEEEAGEKRRHAKEAAAVKVAAKAAEQAAFDAKIQERRLAKEGGQEGVKGTDADGHLDAKKTWKAAAGLASGMNGLLVASDEVRRAP